MKIGNVTLSVIIKGSNGQHRAREFVSPRDQQTFVEGRDGTSFALRVANDNPFRIVAILSVDGLSVIGGERATGKSAGFVLEANSSLDVPGWKVDSASAAQFFFAGSRDGSDQSYVVQMGHGDENKGTIGLIAYKEDVPRRPIGIALAARHGSPLRGAMGGRGLNGEATKSARMQASPTTLSASASTTASMFEATSFEDDLPERTLGTGFGKAVGFETSNVSFRRGALVAQMEIWYEDRRGLKRFGIDVDRAPRRRQAFGSPDSGCTPPPGWNG